MDEQLLQDAILEAVDVVVDSKIRSLNTTSSQIGTVIDDPKGFEVNVRSSTGDVFNCLIVEHLHSWIQKDDIVIFQDLYGNGQKRVVTGKTGQVQTTPSLVFYDEDKDRLISGVDGIFNDEDDKLTYGTVVEE